MEAVRPRNAGMPPDFPRFWSSHHLIPSRTVRGIDPLASLFWRTSPSALRLKIAATRISTTGIPTAGVIAEAVTRTGIVGITAAGFIVVEVVVAPILAVVAGKLIVEPHPGGGTGSRRAARRRRPTSGAGPRDGGTVGRLGEPRWRIAVAHRLRHQSRNCLKKAADTPQ